jgi:glutathione S-transferase
MNGILALPAYKEWLAAALDEPWVLEFDEVDEEPIKVFREEMR